MKPKDIPPVRFVTIGKSSVGGDLKVQTVFTDKVSNPSPYYGIADDMTAVIDLSWLYVDGTPFLLHSEVGGDHSHDGPFTYSSAGGLLIGALGDESHAGFSDFAYVGPGAPA